MPREQNKKQYKQKNTEMKGRKSFSKAKSNDLVQAQLSVNFSSKSIQKLNFESDSSHDQSNQESNDSMASFENMLLQEHLICLKYSISQLKDKTVELLNSTNKLQNMDLEIDWESQEQNLIDYLSSEKSLIPVDQTHLLLQYLQEDIQFHRILEWIYDFVNPIIGDDLILAAHRILLAYLPIKDQHLSPQKIHLISCFPLNIANILNAPSYRILTYSYETVPSFLEARFRQQLLIFLQFFIETLLLVLERYFENPSLTKIKNKYLVNEQISQSEINGSGIIQEQ